MQVVTSPLGPDLELGATEGNPVLSTFVPDQHSSAK